MTISEWREQAFKQIVLQGREERPGDASQIVYFRAREMAKSKRAFQVDSVFIPEDMGGPHDLKLAHWLPRSRVDRFPTGAGWFEFAAPRWLWEKMLEKERAPRIERAVCGIEDIGI